MATISTVLRRDKTNRKGQSPIHFRITKNRKSSYIATGQFLEEKYWDSQKGKVKSSYPNSGRMNAYLTQKLQELQNKVLELETKKNLPSGRAIKHETFGKISPEFIQFASARNEKNREMGRIATYKKHKSTIAKVKEFCTGVIPIADITPQFLEEFEFHLSAVCKNKTNTIHKEMSVIRKYINDAYRLGHIEHSQIPFNKYQLKTEKTTRTFLSESEINSIANLDLAEGSKLRMHRDMFLFGYYAAGTRISDVLTMKWSNFDGTHLHFSMKKTGSQHSIKLPLKAIQILEHMEKPKNLNQFIFAPLTNLPANPSSLQLHNAIGSATALMNKNLKKIAALAEISKPITTHIMRHTWACIALQKGISIDKVGRLLNHGNLRETQIYANLVSSELDKAMDTFN